MAATIGVLLIISKLFFIFLEISCFEYLAYFANLLGFIMDNSIVARWSRTLVVRSQRHSGAIRHGKFVSRNFGVFSLVTNVIKGLGASW